MTILSIKPNELATQRKLTSDALDAVTDELTRRGSHKISSHGQAAHDVRVYNENQEIAVLSNKEKADALYYEELLNEHMGA